ncbi:hypothetical protein CLF_101260 [Clonorchis sinensis]|uniref:Uncharacterized protein n=1 Tax=Clonorchis sinensis TaxID=79923 RepID=G7Y5D0_CLOSI|nr:hypothetical protein CLF_101260 [Clonorchis sinensis]
MPKDRVPHRTLFAQPCAEWNRPRGGQCMTWQRSMKTLTSKLSRGDNYRLSGSGPRDSSDQWLVTLAELSQSRNQWCPCLQCIST